MASQIRASRLKEYRDVKLGLDPAPPSVPTFGEAFRMAYERSFQTLRMAGQYKTYMAAYLDRLAEKTLDQVNASDLEAVRDRMSAMGRKPATVKHVIGMVSRVYSLMARWGAHDGPNPARNVKLPTRDNKRERYLTRDEAGRLLEALKGRSDYVWRLATASLYTGMRKGEIVKLRWEHVNLEAKTISVVDTKTGKNRVVYMPGPLRDMLSAMEPRPGGTVFVRPKQGREDNYAVSQVFVRTVNDLGLNDGIADPRNKVVFHTLRHTFASWLVSQGQSLYTVATLLGHTTTQMTQRYAHLMPETKKAAMETLENFFSPSGTRS
jgi:integrase